MLVAGSTAQAQTFSPSERQMLMQPSTIAGAVGTLQPAAGKSPGKEQPAKGKTNSAPVSFSSELNSATTTSHPAPTLRQGNDLAQHKPFDQRIPFGPLSLGLQAEAGPRSDSLVTPQPPGIGQFKKDRSDPYVGVSIIDIKR
jgi:hypothetical protein